MTDDIIFQDFLRLDIRVGTITDIAEFPEARNPAYKIFIDFGPEIGCKKTSAQITENYTKTELIGTQVTAVVNLPPKQVGPFMSECLVLGFKDAQGHIILTRPAQPVANGERLH